MDLSNIQQPNFTQPSQLQQPDKQIQPTTQEVEVTLARRQSKAENWEPYNKLMGDSQMGILSVSYAMREKYTDVQNDLLNKAPDLLGKDWDFSVDEKGEIVILEGKDKLTESEVNQLTKILEDNNMDKFMNALAEHVINHGKGARGPEGFAEAGSLAGYDINKENFKDIVFGRELMLNMKATHNTKLTQSETNYYASKKVSLGAPQRELQLRAIEGYNKGKQPPSQVIASQIMTRASVKY